MKKMGEVKGALSSLPPPKIMGQALRRYGRDGDSILAHINPSEAALLKKRGGLGTPHPVTGLPEFRDDDNGPGGGGRGESTSAGEGSASTSGVGDGTAGTGNNGRGDGNGDGGNAGRGFQPGNNPEMGGGVARSRGLDSVAALGDYGRNVNAASSVMAGRDVSFSDRAADTFGRGAPGGFSKSPAAGFTAGVLGTVIGGPMVGMAAYHGYNMAMRDAPVGKSIGSIAGGLLGGPVGGMLGGKLGSMIEDGMYDHNPAQAGYMGITGSPSGPSSSGGGAMSGTGRGENDSGSDYGARAGVGYMLDAPAIPASTLEMAPSAPEKKGFDEEGFLKSHPEVRAAVKNGTWTSGEEFDKAYQAWAGVPYAQAMTAPRGNPEDMLNAAPGQAIPYRG